MPLEKITIDELKKMKKAEREELKTLLTERARLTRQIKSMEEEVKVLNETITPMMRKHDIKSIIHEDDEGFPCTFTRVAGCNTSIKKEELLIAGVSADIIERATKRTEYESLQVKRIPNSQE